MPHDPVRVADTKGWLVKAADTATARGAAVSVKEGGPNQSVRLFCDQVSGLNLAAHQGVREMTGFKSLLGYFWLQEKTASSFIANPLEPPSKAPVE
jgi:hypothetical protein